MHIHPSRVLTALWLCGLTIPAMSQAPAGDLKAKLEEYGRLIRDRTGAKDKRAKAIIDELMAGVDKMKEGEKRRLAKGIAASLSSPRCKRKPTQGDLFRTTILALGMVGKHGSGHLLAAFGNDKFGDKEWNNLRGEMLEALGATKDEGKGQAHVKFLVKTARNHHVPEFMARAGGALRHFADAKLAVRRDIVDALIKKFAKLQNAVDSRPGALDQSSRVKLVAVRDPWNKTLRSLTRRKLSGTQAWMKFWNKHKNENWDAKKSRKKRRERRKT